MKQLIICVLSLLVITGCTASLWESPTFTERVKGYYVVPEEDLLIINGEEYSYIFNISNSFKDILAVSHELDFEPRYEYFEIDNNNTVTGRLELTSKIMDDSPKAKMLLELGFTKTSNGFLYETQLSGKLYKIEGELEVTPFDKEQLIKVKEPEGGISKVAKIIVTPVAVTADAVAIVSLLTLSIVAYYSAMFSK